MGGWRGGVSGGCGPLWGEGGGGGEGEGSGPGGCPLRLHVGRIEK